MSVHRRTWYGGIAAGASVLIAGLTACGGPSSADSGSAKGLPPTIKIMSIKEMSGAVAFAGTNSTKGIDLAVEQINQQKFLGDSKLEIDLKDSAASAQQAASLATQAISDKSYAAILGPAASGQATAISPIAQKSGMPVVYTQAGSDGVLVGNYTYRVTAPAESYYELAGQYLKSKQVKTASVLFNSGNPTLTQLGQKTVPALGDKYGFKVQSSDGVQVTAQDFTANASKIAAAKPDAVVLLLTGPQDPVGVTQLRQNGYRGEIVGMTSMGAGNLKTAGQKAAGVVWPSNFSALATDESTNKFVEAYKAKYGEVPNNYAAEAYDAAWFLARGIKEANSTSRSEIQKGLAKVAASGFDGAQGAMTFDGNDVRVPGVLAGWDGTDETLVPLGSS
jgi:branched-chain amino acid transport system substrate-binding protein